MYILAYRGRAVCERPRMHYADSGTADPVAGAVAFVSRAVGIARAGRCCCLIVLRCLLERPIVAGK